MPCPEIKDSRLVIVVVLPCPKIKDSRRVIVVVLACPALRYRTVVGVLPCLYRAVVGVGTSIAIPCPILRYRVEGVSLDYIRHYCQYTSHVSIQWLSPLYHY